MTTLIGRDIVRTKLRPRYEGANIRTWIGFKHLMYLAEESVLAWFRQRGYGPQRLFHEFGLSMEIIDASVLLPALLEIDDEVVAEASADGSGRFWVRLRVSNGLASRVVLTGKLTTALVPLHDASGRVPLPAGLAPVAAWADAFAVERVNVPLSGGDPGAVLTLMNPGAFYWPWQARYFLCHCSDRLQHSAYVRTLEEVVDRFLADRGLSIGRMLADRGLIPVVSRVRARTLAPVAMEETVHTTFVVDDVLKEMAYDARMDCYVQREDVLYHVANARILHGYAFSSGPNAGTLARLDAAMLDALTERRPQ